ncbi:MAG: FABP family protein [Acidimicrobiia bacterium]|nr:FABP family protein [Acidimicrobiia bacterium]MBT8194733.1 FABP family protein [Acidimicrobiia bacterium]MBT8248160.1 FABP family protein [Acidimicrobiia bacterium]NNF89655.1 FABP family protein [Acidimicrobiia bacterium]NNJ47682.1 FABP family protein [Acidimicrobiia bacterium]
MDLHPLLEPIRFLVGSWHGTGRGEYPTIESFGYREDVSFLAGPGKPFLFYTQRTRSEADAPLHSEAGYVRMTPDGPELVVAQPTGLVEVHGGELTGTTLVFESTTVGATETAKAVERVVRRITGAGETLSYTLDMAYAGVPLTVHLAATLYRV